MINDLNGQIGNSSNTTEFTSSPNGLGDLQYLQGKTLRFFTINLIYLQKKKYIYIYKKYQSEIIYG